MKKTFLFSLGLVLSLTMVTSCGKKTPVKTEGPPPVTESTQTQLVIVNASNEPVVVWVTLGATPGCLQHVGQIPYITDSLAPLSGYFTLNAHDSTEAYAPAGMGFNGNFSFNTPPLNCPTPLFPNGVNIFEFIINNGFQAPNAQETVDISCVAGVNCGIRAYFTGDSSWNAGTTVPTVDSIYNAGLNDNAGLTGIYPYGCDVCTGRVSPPECATGTNCQTKPICNIQRNATSSGGIIYVVYAGSM